MKKIKNKNYEGYIDYIGYVSDTDWLCIEAIQKTPKEVDSILQRTSDALEFNLYPFKEQIQFSPKVHRVFFGKEKWQLVTEENPQKDELETVSKVLSKGNMSNRPTEFFESIKKSQKNLVDWSHATRPDSEFKFKGIYSKHSHIYNEFDINPLIKELTNKIFQEVQAIVNNHKSVEEKKEKYVIGFLDCGHLFFVNSVSEKETAIAFTNKLNDVMTFEHYFQAKKIADVNFDIKPKIYLYSDLLKCEIITGTSFLIGKEVNK